MKGNSSCWGLWALFSVQVIINITLETLVRPHITAAGPEHLSLGREMETQQNILVWGSAPAAAKQEIRRKRESSFVLLASKLGNLTPVHCSGKKRRVTRFSGK